VPSICIKRFDNNEMICNLSKKLRFLKDEIKKHRHFQHRSFGDYASSSGIAHKQLLES